MFSGIPPRLHTSKYAATRLGGRRTRGASVTGFMIINRKTREQLAVCVRAADSVACLAGKRDDDERRSLMHCCLRLTHRAGVAVHRGHAVTQLPENNVSKQPAARGEER